MYGTELDLESGTDLGPGLAGSKQFRQAQLECIPTGQVFLAAAGNDAIHSEIKIGDTRARVLLEIPHTSN